MTGGLDNELGTLAPCQFLNALNRVVVGVDNFGRTELHCDLAAFGNRVHHDDASTHADGRSSRYKPDRAAAGYNNCFGSIGAA